MNASKQPANCLVCYRTEERGTQSKRLQENERWIDSFTNPKLKYLDFRISSKCNLKCITCAVSESSAWLTDTKKFEQVSKNPEIKEFLLENLAESEVAHDDLNWFWSDFEKVLLDLEEIYFAGGEPLIQVEHQRCLDLMIKKNFASKIRLVYNTNGTAVSEQLIQQWSKFASVQINLSLDAVAERNEYIRFPSKWSQISRALELLEHSPANISARITTTVFALNVMYLDELFFWKINSKFKKIQTVLAAGDLDINLLHFPKYLNVQLLPQQIKVQIESRLSKLLVLNEISEPVKAKVQGLISFMNEQQIPVEKGLAAFKEYLELLDFHRQPNSKTLFPFLSEING